MGIIERIRTIMKVAERGCKWLELSNGRYICMARGCAYCQMDEDDKYYTDQLRCKNAR